MSGKTSKKSKAGLKAVYNRAVRNELIEKNPVARVAAPKFDNTLVRYLIEEQEVRLFEVLPERLHPIVIVALHTGCRQGELLKLVWGMWTSMLGHWQGTRRIKQTAEF